MAIDDTKFLADNAQMLADAQKVQDDIKQAQQDHTDYINKLKDPNLNANYALILLFYIMGASNQDSTALGQWTDQSGITGDRLAFNGQLTTTINDLNNMTQSNDKDPQSLIVFGKDMNKVLDELTDAGGAFSYLDSDPTKTPSGQTTMDPDAQGSIVTQLTGIRQEFKLGLPYDPTGTDVYYFDPTGGDNAITNFWQFQQDLGEQGDVQGSTDAAKLMTDNFSTITQTGQTASAVLNNDQKNYTSMMQTVQSFLAAIAQWWSTQVKNSNSHMSSGS